MNMSKRLPILKDLGSMIKAMTERWGAVSMTPAALETLIGGIESISVPTLVLSGEYDTLTPADPLVDAIYANIGTTEKNYGTLLKAGHYTFANACDFVNTYPDCGEDHMPIPFYALINRLTLNLFRKTPRNKRHG